MTSNDLRKSCVEAMRSGVDFPTLWHSVIKPHPSVKGPPVQKHHNGRPFIEIPLARGDRLVVDFDNKDVRLA